MDEIKETILADAIETAIRETRKNIKLKRVIIIESLLLIILSVIVILGG